MDYLDYSKTELIALCKKREIPANASLIKKTLIERLVQNDKESFERRKKIEEHRERVQEKMRKEKAKTKFLKEINFDELEEELTALVTVPVPVPVPEPVKVEPVVEPVKVEPVKVEPVIENATAGPVNVLPVISSKKSTGSTGSSENKRRSVVPVLDYLFRCSTGNKYTKEWQLMKSFYHNNPDKFMVSGLGHTSNLETTTHFNLTVNTSGSRDDNSFKYRCDYHVYYTLIGKFYKFHYVTAIDYDFNTQKLEKRIVALFG